MIHVRIQNHHSFIPVPETDCQGRAVVFMFPNKYTSRPSITLAPFSAALRISLRLSMSITLTDGSIITENSSSVTSVSFQNQRGIGRHCIPGSANSVSVNKDLSVQGKAKSPIINEPMAFYIDQRPVWSKYCFVRISTRNGSRRQAE